MADSKITGLSELTSVVDADVLAIVDDAGGDPVTKKITRANLLKVGTDIAAYTHTHAYAAQGANGDITSLTGLTTDLSVAQGGTGASTHTAGNVLLGAGTSAITSRAIGIADNNITEVDSTTIAADDLARFTANGLEGVKCKWDAADEPDGTTNDSSEGYVIGSRWLDISNHAEYVCTDASVGAALWQALGGGGATLSGSTNNTVCTVTSANNMQGEANLTFDGTDLKVSTAPVKVAGLEDMWVPANAMRPASTNGCAAITDVETTAGRPDMQVLDFDSSTAEYAQFSVGMPKSWNGGTVTASFYWTHATAVSTDVIWGIQGVCVSDNDTIDTAYGASQTVTDTFHNTAEDLAVTATTGAITLAGSPADGDLAFFRVFRHASTGGDTTDSTDARLLGVKIHYTTNAANDA
jgi:hypothetical protein